MKANREKLREAEKRKQQKALAKASGWGQRPHVATEVVEVGQVVHDPIISLYLIHSGRRWMELV